MSTSVAHRLGYNKSQTRNSATVKQFSPLGLSIFYIDVIVLMGHLGRLSYHWNGKYPPRRNFKDLPEYICLVTDGGGGFFMHG